MPLKIQLSTTDEVLNLTPDPEGLDKFELELRRSRDHQGVFYEFGVNLKFFKDGRRMIRDVYEQFGIDGQIECRIFEYNPNTYKFEKIYTGQLRLQDYEIDEIGVEVNIEQVGIEREFENKMKIDRDIPVSDSVFIPPKTILKRLDVLPSSSDTFTRSAAITFNFSTNDNGQDRFDKAYIMFNGQDVILEEFGDSFNQQGLSYVVSEFDALQFLEVLPDSQGIYDFNFRMKHGFLVKGRKLLSGDVDVGASSTHTPAFVMTCYFEHRDSANNVITKSSLGSYDSVVEGTFVDDDVSFDFGQVSYSDTGVQVDTGDRLYLYYELDLGSGDFNVSNPPNTIEYDVLINSDIVTFNSFRIEVDAKTQFPESEVASTYPFEMFDSIISQNSGGKLKLRSDFFGREDLDNYDSDGQGSLLAITNGHKLRQDNFRKVFANFNDAFETFNSMYCLGWGYEFDEEEKQNYVRIEKKEFFFDKSATTLVVTASDGLIKRADKDLYYTRVEVGYPEYENIGASNATDEFNTQRRYAVNIGQADNVLELFSKFRASCYEIESQRRQVKSTEKNKLDEENFLIALIRDVSGLRVETGADYETINGIFDPDTAFNIRIVPTSFIENWRPILSSVTLRRTDKAFQFTYGEGNYALEIDGLEEDRDIVMVDSEAIYYCEEYEFETGITTNERQLVVSNPKQLIEVEDWIGNRLKGFLLSKKTVLEEKKATFILLRANIIENQVD